MPKPCLLLLATFDGRYYTGLLTVWKLSHDEFCYTTDMRVMFKSGEGVTVGACTCV